MLVSFVEFWERVRWGRLFPKRFPYAAGSNKNDSGVGETAQPGTIDRRRGFRITVSVH